MIKSIHLENFLSYEDGFVDLSGSTIAVVGDNGVGKSAFLESIPYAYFGIGRETKEGMSRIKGDGSHRVEITDDEGISIIRGRKPSGAGFTEVRNGTTLIAKGTEADEWIVKRLGIDADTFMLTSFFGLGDTYTDKLLRVLPSARLDALQELAQVGPYRDFLSKAKADYSTVELANTKEQARKEGAESAIANASNLSTRLAECEGIVKSNDSELDALKKVRAELQTQEAAYQALVSERERLIAERKHCNGLIADALADIKESESSISQETTSLSAARKSLAEMKKTVESMDVAKINADIDDLRNDIAAKKTVSQLKGVASKLDASAIAQCPLCNQAVTAEIIASWSESVSLLNTEVDFLSKNLTSLLESSKQYTSTVSKIEKLKAEIEDSVETVEEAKKIIAEAQIVLKHNRGEVEAKDIRYNTISEKLGDEYRDLQKKIAGILADIDECHHKRGVASGEIVQLKESLQRVDESKAIIQKSEKMIAEYRDKMEALNVLKTAWSRYGIPLQLVNRLTTRIEGRASAMYREFDNGSIEVREVDDRGKPGIQFFLVDRKGERTFGQLSMGEKIMFFISIRVAIAQIVAEDSPINVNFLVLDEAMGNLSPRSCDNLIRLINKSLRKIFPQLILVTHTAMPEIFDKSLFVTMSNDVSILKMS